MQKSLLLLVMMFAGAGTAIAQSKPAPGDATGGAYYEFMLGLHLETKGDASGATAAYLRAEKLDPTSAEIPAALAELYQRLNRPADAIAAGERAVHRAGPARADRGGRDAGRGVPGNQS
jgi:hypothetical protein